MDVTTTSLGTPDIPIKGLAVYKNDKINSNGYGGVEMGVPVPWEDRGEAQLVSSLREDGSHALLLDLDMPAYLIPSSTPGKSHLYVDVRMTREQMMGVMLALENAGVIQSAWVHLTDERGQASLRTPWTRKTKKADNV
jgi:hypothetical protein